MKKKYLGVRIKKGIWITRPQRIVTSNDISIIINFLGLPPGLINYRHKFTEAKKLKRSVKPPRLSVTVRRGSKKIIAMFLIS